MTSLSLCLCRQSCLTSPATAHAALKSSAARRNFNARLFGRVGVAPLKLQSPARALCPVSWWQEDGSVTPKASKQKWQFFWRSRGDPAASIINSENLPEDSSKADTVSSHSIWEQIQKLQKVDLSHAILGISKKDETWTVPWTGETIFQVMFLWFLSFWFVGSWIIPLLAHAAGFSKDTLTYRGQALYSLVTDIAEGTVGLAILYRCLARFHPLPNKWFNISWKGNWHINACLGCLMFPLVHRLSQINLDLLPVPSPFTASNVEQSILARDPVAMLLYAIVVSICAPIWEEVIFRGFLLPSLTRYMPIWSSILVSAVAFALAHFSVQRLLPLTFLGLVMGIVFVRSRNLLASMLLHSLWNGFVFLDLLR